MVINVFWNVPRREVIFETLIYFHAIGCNYILLEKLQTSMTTPAVLVQQYISIGGNCQIYIMSFRYQYAILWWGHEYALIRAQCMQKRVYILYTMYIIRYMLKNIIQYQLYIMWTGDKK